MIGNALADLDELVLLCRDERARAYIIEAVSCYRGGAYRSAIVATWIAVCFDIIDKLRDLALAGDKQAEQLVEDIEKTRSSNDLTRALKFEREILPVARDKFELISHLEFIDLERLQQDRNRCAHPSLISEEQHFNPSGELSRLHIRCAVSHLLQHPPVQGKHALERILREVGSEYFPDEVSDATSWFSSGPLKRPRESLVRNLTIVLLKQALDATINWKAKLRIFAALGAIRYLHKTMFEAAIQQKLTALIRGLDDANLDLATFLLRQIDDCWNYLEQDVQHRLENYAASLPSEQFSDIEPLLEYEPLRVQALARLERSTRRELTDALFIHFCEEVADKCIRLYLSARSFAAANEMAQVLTRYVKDFSAAQQCQIVEGIAVNDQITGSFEVGTLVTALRNSKKLSATEFENLLELNGLQQFKQSA